MKKSNYVNKATYILVGTVLILATFASLVGLGLISLGVGGITFNF